MFVRCVTCNGPLSGSASTGRNGKKYPRYHCTNPDCHSAYIKPEELHEQFLELLIDIRPDADKLKFLQTMIVRVWRDEAKTIHNRRRKAREEMERLGEDRLDAAEGVIKGLISPEDKVALTSRLKHRTVKLKAELAKLDDLAGAKENAID